MKLKGNALRFVGAAAMATAMLAATTQPAHAAMLLTLDDGIPVDFKSITDGSIVVGNVDLNPLSDVITFIGSVGATWTINVSTGISFPNTGADARIELNSINVSSGAGNLTIRLYDDGFSLSTYPASVNEQVGGTLNGPAGSKVTFDASVGGTPLPTYVAGPGAYSTSLSTLYGGPSGFTMIAQAVIHATGVSSTSFNQQLDASVPEPASMLLLGTGLLALARRRRAKKA